MPVSLEERRRRSRNAALVAGQMEPVNDGFLKEAAQGLGMTTLETLRGFASTAQEFGLGGDGAYDYFDSQIAAHPHWRPDPEYTPLSLNPGNIGRTIGNAAGTTLPTLAVGALTMPLGGPVSTAASAAAVFGQLYGDNVKDYRARFAGKGYSDDAIMAIAASRTLVDSFVEVGLGSVPAGMRAIRNLAKAGGAAAKAGSAAGRTAAAGLSGAARDTIARAAVGEASRRFGSNVVMRVLKNMGRGAVEEGTEEVVQGLNDIVHRMVMGDDTAVNDVRTLPEQFAGGAWGGALFGAAAGLTDNRQQNGVFRDRRNDRPVPPWMNHFVNKDNAEAELEDLVRHAPRPQKEGDWVPSAKDFAIVEPYSKGAKLLAGVAKQLHLNVRFFVPLTEDARSLNGLYAKDTGVIYIDASASTKSPIKTLGHEFYELLHRTDPELAGLWAQTMWDGVDPEVRQEAEAKLRAIYGEGADITKEFHADLMGDMFMDPEMWTQATDRALAKGFPFAEKLMKLFDRFIAAIKQQLDRFKGGKQLIRDLEKARAAAAETIAEYKRRREGVPVPLDQSPQTGQTLPPYKMYRQYEAGRAADMARFGAQGAAAPAQTAGQTAEQTQSRQQTAPDEAQIPAPDVTASAPAADTAAETAPAPQNTPSAPAQEAVTQPPEEEQHAPAQESSQRTSGGSPAEVRRNSAGSPAELPDTGRGDDDGEDGNALSLDRYKTWGGDGVPSLSRPAGEITDEFGDALSKGGRVLIGTSHGDLEIFRRADGQYQVKSPDENWRPSRTVSYEGAKKIIRSAVESGSRKVGIRHEARPDSLNGRQVVTSVPAGWRVVPGNPPGVPAGHRLVTDKTDPKVRGGNYAYISEENLRRQGGGTRTQTAQDTEKAEPSGERTRREPSRTETRTETRAEEKRQAAPSVEQKESQTGTEENRTFRIQGRDENLTAQEIIEDGSISADTPILNAEGSEVWGEITPEMAEAGREFGLEALPIKMLKGLQRRRHSGFGLAHFYVQHGAELESNGVKLIDFLDRIFRNPDRIYVSRQGKLIRLELVTDTDPRNKGVLELKREDGFYSIVTAYQMEWPGSKIHGKEIWRRSVPNRHPTSGEPNPLSRTAQDKPHVPLERLGPDSGNSITPSGEKSSVSDEKTSENTKKSTDKRTEGKKTGRESSPPELENRDSGVKVKETTKQEEAGNGTGSESVRKGQDSVSGAVSQKISVPPAEDAQAAGTHQADRKESSGGGDAVSESAAGRSERGGVRNGGVADDGRGRRGVQRGGDGSSEEAVGGELSGDGSVRLHVSSERSGLKPENYRIRPGDVLVPGGDVSKIKANIAAVRLLKQLERENREATPEEKRVLAQYTGWGGLPNVFRPGNQYYDQLKGILTDEEFASARRSTLNAHYTDRSVISGMWKLAARLGFKGGRVGEFGAGIGHFLGLVPDSLASRTRFHAVEMDSISGRMLAKLYPKAKVTVAGLQYTDVENDSLDMVIGNFPFAKDGPFDDRYPRVSLHDYFFLRALDAVRPGGLIIAVTSTGTMDSFSSEETRRMIGGRADLVGAIRLPQDAFAKNAGTSVVTDIVVLRKKGGVGGVKGAAWEYSDEMSTSDDTGLARVNVYYHHHPDMMLGRLSNTGSMYHGSSKTLLAREGQDTAAELEKAIEKFPENITSLKEDKASFAAEDRAARQTPQEKHRVGEHFIRDGKLYVAESDAETEQTAKNIKQRIEAVKRLSPLVKSFNDLLEAMHRGDSDAVIGKLQKDLRRAYDAFVSVAKSKHLSDKAFGFLRMDPNFARIAGLETRADRLDKDGKQVTTYRLADIFTKRTVQKTDVPQTAGNLTDAGQISMYQRGRIDPAYMAGLLGRSEEDVRREMLSGDSPFYEDPATGEIESAVRYLSGNIVQKLGVAERAAAERPELKRNVDALKKARPERKTISQIKVALQATWIPQDLVQRWAREFFGAPYMSVRYLERFRRWTVSGLARVDPKYKISDKLGGAELLERTLNFSDMKVYRHDYATDRNVLDRDATSAAREFRRQMEQSFSDWVMKTPDAARAVEDAYNEKINHTVNLKISDTSLPGRFPGMARIVKGIKDFALRKHQRRAVMRAVQDGRMLFAHCVGAGKTFAMITTAMELKRLGLAHKSLVVAQNSTLEQFGGDISALYPDAKVLVADDNALKKENRRLFMSQVASGDWDIVVIAQSTFDMIPLKDETVRRSVDSMLEEIREAREATGNKESIKNIERSLQNAKNMADGLLKAKRDESMIPFEDMGFDALFVDETQRYKKYPFYTRMGRVKGLDVNPNKRSFALGLKIAAVKERSGGRNIYFATGTPVTNTLTEAWTMVRYLAPDVLEQFNVKTFDEFAALFTSTVAQPEFNAAGMLRMVERFASYNNLEELGKFFGSVADVVMQEDLEDVKLPKLKGGGPTRVSIPRGRRISQIMNYFLDLYLWYEGLSGEQKQAAGSTPLQVYSMARAATIDMRLIDPTLPDDPDSKLNYAVRKALEIYRRYEQQKGAQVIFADLYRSRDGRFNVYKELKKKLIEGGVPENEIALVHEISDKKKRESLFAAVREGRVRFILGSTQLLGIGVNIQDRLAAEINLDAPMLPADMEQRRGRIERQGNMIEEPEILNLAVEQTLDAALYQMLARKQRFITQVIKGAASGSVSLEDFDVANDYASFAAMVSGNPDALRRVEIDAELRKLLGIKNQHQARVTETRDVEIPHLQTQIKASERSMSLLEQLAERHGKTEFGGELDVTVDGRRVDGGRKDVLAALDDVVRSVLAGSPGDRARNVTINGVSVQMGYQLLVEPKAAYEFVVDGETTRVGGAVTSATGLLRSMTSRLAGLRGDIESAKAETEGMKADLAAKREFAGRTDFEGQSQIDELSRERAEIDARIGAPDESRKVTKRPRLSQYVEGAHDSAADLLWAEEDDKQKESAEEDDDNAAYSLSDRSQVNPVETDARIRAEYAAELGKGYTPESVAEWDRKAVDWILRQGGVDQAVDMVLNDTEHSDRHVAGLVRRHLMNSSVFASLDPEKRAKLELKHVFAGTEWGREGVARKLASLTLDSYEKVKALFERLHRDMPDPERVRMRNRILDETGVDVYNLPKDIADDKRRLDALLRSMLAARATTADKLYEYWINAILSGPATHARNIAGNTLNAAYELGAKRVVEAAINLIARDRRGATFGEMLEMWRHVGWKAAWKRALLAYDLEALSPAGKYIEGAAVAVGGRAGRIVRVPGRLLRAADELAKGLFAPLEAAAYAYRKGRADGLRGTALRRYITRELSDPRSEASRRGEQRALELTYQEDPGELVRHLISLKSSRTPAGRIASFLFPFVKTPANLLRQGVRKSPLGIVSLAVSDIPAAIRSREITPEFVAHAAEQILAWGVLMLLAGGGDDDDRGDGMPLITGTGAAYGSPERNFKSDKVPPLSVRIGGRYYSYKYLEPLASGLAITANALEALRARRPEDAKKALIGMSGFIAEKSYLDSIRELYEYMQDPERSGTKFATNFAASWVPNAYRQAVAAFDDKLRDNRTRARGAQYFADQFRIVTNAAGITRALPRLDYWGREVSKDAYADSAAGPLARLLAVQAADPDKSMDAADRLLWRYNQLHPESQWWPGLPAYTATSQGRRYIIAGEDYHKYAQYAGELAHRQVLRGIRLGYLNAAKPSERDIALIRQVMTRARKEARAKYARKFKRM